MSTTRRAILIVTVATVGLWAWGRWTPPESPIVRAYRECGECSGLEPSDVDALIRTVRQSTLNREENLELYRQHAAGGPDVARDCEPCTLAIIEAAGK